MRIGIDARVLQEGNGGIFVYAKNLLEHLVVLARHHDIHLFANQRVRRPNPALAQLCAHPNVTLHQYRFPNKFLNAAFHFKSWPNIDELVGGCDVLFFPSMMYSAWSPKTKTVLTMHDLSYEFFPEYFTRRQQLWHRFMNPKFLCERADAIIAVSENTRQDIIARYGIGGQKIARIHSGIDSRFRPVVDRATLVALRARYDLPDARYILQTGTIEPRKNHSATLAAYEQWRAQYPEESRNTHLLFAGHTGWKSGRVLSDVRGSRFHDTIHVACDVSAADFPALYSLASVVLYPSFYEGFGFPVLEAFACGVPVITSNTSSLCEVAGDAAFLVNPYRVDELVYALREILNKPDFARALRARGLLRTVSFGWERAAKETLSILEYAHRN